jgi:hypothetical protein
MTKELIIEELILFILLRSKNILKITKKRAQHYDYALFFEKKVKKYLFHFRHIYFTNKRNCIL